MDAIMNASLEQLQEVNEVGRASRKASSSLFRRKPQNRELVERLRKKRLDAEGRPEGTRHATGGKTFVLTEPSHATRRRSKKLIEDAGGK